MNNVIAFPSPRPSKSVKGAEHTPWRSRRTVLETESGHEEGGWKWPVLAPHLPTGLPVRAVTLIKIPAFVPAASEQVVGDLLRATIAAGDPCVYAPVNGSPHYPLVTDGSGAHVVVDQDVSASVVDPDTQTRQWYECGVPSLQVLAPKVAKIEAAQGTALLVMDGIQGARPYKRALRGEETAGFGDLVTLDRHGLAYWRACDVLEYARLRPLAPTVVVWHTAPHDEDHGGYSALVEVAHVVINCYDLSEGPRMLVSSRPNLDEPLPYQTPVW